MMRRSQAGLLASVALAMMAAETVAEIGAPRLPREREPSPFTHADEERLTAAQAKRDRKAAKRKGAKP